MHFFVTLCCVYTNNIVGVAVLPQQNPNLKIRDAETENEIIGVDDQAVSLSDDGTTIIIDFFSSFLFSLSFFLSFYRHSTRHTLHLHFNPD